jgi:ectoine hydroxylase-related dioxygenase (phytanoyl-CoA dioxygenase family)
MTDSSELRKQIEAHGYAVVPGVLDREQLAGLIVALESIAENPSARRRGGVFAMRNLLDVSPAIRDLAESGKVRRLIGPILGSGAFPVRGILFDKTPDANWKVPWHQDVTIAVSNRVNADGFGPWSMKAGVLHVQPPARILENMISVRIHLDQCGEENGALRVVSGSHLLGKLPEQQSARMGAEASSAMCPAEAGDAVLMRPLLVHASSASTTPKHRRVIHIDFAAVDLPDGMRWYQEAADYSQEIKPTPEGAIEYRG